MTGCTAPRHDGQDEPALAITAAAKAFHDFRYDCEHVPPLGANEHELHWAECLEDASLALAAAVPLIAAQVEAYAANYPEDVFPPDGTSRDAIGGTAMRHAYANAARMIREMRP